MLKALKTAWIWTKTASDQALRAMFRNLIMVGFVLYGSIWAFNHHVKPYVESQEMYRQESREFHEIVIQKFDNISDTLQKQSEVSEGLVNGQRQLRRNQRVILDKSINSEEILREIDRQTRIDNITMDKVQIEENLDLKKKSDFCKIRIGITRRDGDTVINASFRRIK
jgi:hypothetical protein